MQIQILGFGLASALGCGADERSEFQAESGPPQVGVATALGCGTYGRGFMLTVGADLVRLDAYAALVAILAQAVTVHVFAGVGVPVSTSQALVGGVIGVGIMRGARGIDRGVLKNIVLAWILTPIAAALLAGGAARLLAIA